MATFSPTLTPTSLLEAMPDAKIFYHMSGLSFLPDANVKAYLDLEYFYNRSGSKAASPLVELQTDTSTLAAMIVFRYKSKWEQLFRQYASFETLDLLDNINKTRTTLYGKSTATTSNDTKTYNGTESHTHTGSETVTESSDSSNPYTSSRSITGGYTDADSRTKTRTGTESTEESYPTSRTTTRKTTGGYSDTDSTSSTRSGSQALAESGNTETSVFGFNSSTAVKASRVDPNTTSTTTYNSLKDTRAGAITRDYGTGLTEQTTESGSRKVSTSYGNEGIVDANAGNVQRTYNNYHDTVTETGTKTRTTSYGSGGKVDELSFNNRSDATSSSGSVTASGTDTVTETGRDYSSLIEQYLALFMNACSLDFLDIVYNDVDEVLTCPFYA